MLPTDTFLPYMPDVRRCEQSLRELNLIWRLIESSAKMNCPLEARSILPTMAATREGFDRLERDLVTSLIGEKIATVLAEIGTKAQYVIDIVVRNLYERTADVGFLATDHELCAFVAGLTDDAGAIRQRLRAYQSKYTVYDEIILLDSAGNVLVQIDETSPLEGSTDPLLARTLTSDSYVETFRASDLRPGRKQALIYSRRMRHPHTGGVIGVLCLCFNFEQEMAGIFHSHRDPQGRSNMLLLDGDNRVIESADPVWMPPGVAVPVNCGTTTELHMFAGRRYLVRTFAATGYQGYMGPPGWQGQVMVPVDVAFSGPKNQTLADLPPALAAGLLSHAQSFSPPLFEIMSAAETIRRVVWNGQVMTAGKHGELLKLKTILDQISETGARSNELFSESIRELYETVLAARLSDAEFGAHLLVDLLDRNLYERSDDCRWWALTPELRAVLAASEREPTALRRLSEILGYINGLYTVYTRLFVYDAQGRIVAASQPQQANGNSILGTTIEPRTLEQVLALRSEQDYHVTPFEPSPLYGGQPTYIYHAAIRDPAGTNQVVGGIGIVFDAAPEFGAMLRNGLAGKAGAQAYYVDRSGYIISSSDAAHPTGSRLDLPADLLTLPNGNSSARIVVHDGQYAILGCSVSSGYREFKVSDGYRDDVLSVVFDFLGETREQAGAGQRPSTALSTSAVGQAGHEFATFFSGDALLALPAAHVLEALPALRISSVAIGKRRARIGMLALEMEGGGSCFVWVFDLGYLLHGRSSDIGKGSQVVIVRHDDQLLGLLVDELHGVPEFGPEDIMHTPFGATSEDVLIRRFIKANAGQTLLQVLDVPTLFAKLTRTRSLQAEAA